MTTALSGSPRLVTAEEAAALITRLTGAPCSARQVRYLLLTGGLGTDTQAGRRGQTRLFGSFDVALVRTAVCLQQGGLSAALARSVLTYLRNDIILAWRSSAAVSVMVQGLKGSLEPTLKGRPAAARAWVPLRDVWRGLEPELQKVRAEEPDVWLWKKVPARTVAEARGRTHGF